MTTNAAGISQSGGNIFDDLEEKNNSSILSECYKGQIRFLYRKKVDTADESTKVIDFDNEKHFGTKVFDSFRPFSQWQWRCCADYQINQFCNSGKCYVLRSKEEGLSLSKLDDHDRAWKWKGYSKGGPIYIDGSKNDWLLLIEDPKTAKEKKGKAIV